MTWNLLYRLSSPQTHWVLLSSVFVSWLMELEAGATNNPMTNISFFLNNRNVSFRFDYFKLQKGNCWNTLGLNISDSISPCSYSMVGWKTAKFVNFALCQDLACKKLIEWRTSSFEKFTDAPYSPWSKRAACYTGTCRENPEADPEKGAEVKRNIGHWPYWQWRVNSFRLTNLKKK